MIRKLRYLILILVLLLSLSTVLAQGNRNGNGNGNGNSNGHSANVTTNNGNGNGNGNENGFGLGNGGNPGIGDGEGCQGLENAFAHSAPGDSNYDVLLNQLTLHGCITVIMDEDGDGVPDDQDQCPGEDDTIDLDQNGIPDCLEEENPDRDGDSIPNEEDNCPDVFNPDQTDEDGDGIGAACDEDDSIGNGDIQFRLTWTGDDDMDLHVWDPDGAHIYFGATSSPSGGQLDIDDIPGCGSSATAQHIENIFWPVGASPTGIYYVTVDAWDSCDGIVADWTLEVFIDGVLVFTYSDNTDRGGFSYAFPIENP